MIKHLIPWHRHGEKIPARRGAEAGVGEFGQLRDEFQSMFDRFWNDSSGALADLDRWDIASGCDLEDHENEITVRAEAPGFDPQEIEVSMSGNRLVMQAEHKEQSDGNGSRYRYGKFYRSVTVPRGIEADKIQAEYKNGVLEVHLPKGPEAQAKRIPVKSS